MFRAIEVSSNQAENPVGFVGIRGPDFRAVDEVVVAHVLRFCAQASKIRSRIGLAVTLAPTNLAVDDVRNVLLLLLFGCVEQQSWAQHIQTKATQRTSSADARHFFAQDLSFGARETTAAVFSRPAWCCPAFCGHAL